jgi:serine/threonine protein kinase
VSLVGTSVHSIRLVERLGAGGMGRVYLGIDERLQRRVAVKAIHGDRRMDADARLRFRREARVLSQLEHPNVCRLYEYIEGDDDDFLVLELVQGRNLRQMMEEGLPFARKLDIAAQIAGALAAAHAVSVVHRDLKPDNVMVTPDGVVKVLDFGLARAPAGEEAGRTPPRARVPGARPDGEFAGSSALTQVGSVLGTPRYMSPEQARGEAVTAASDMYSFGLLLQEAFTGRPPYGDVADRGELVQRSMWGDAERVVGIDGDLAELVERLKALPAKERPTAEAAAARLRWIAGKTARRARALAAAGVAVVLAAAAVVSTVGSVRARRAQARAEDSERTAVRAQTEAQAVNAFLAAMLSSPDPARAGREVRVLEVLDRASETVDADFADHPDRRAAVLETLGRTYHAVGELSRGQEMISRALALRRQTLGPRAPETLAAMHHLGRVLAAMARSDQAESLLRETLALREEILGKEHPDTLATVEALAWTLHGAQRLGDAEMLYRRVYEARLRTLGEEHRETLAAKRLVGMVLRDQRRFDEAETLLVQCYETAARLYGKDGPFTVEVLQSVAFLYHRQGRDREAVPLLRSLQETMRRVMGPDHPATLKVANTLGRSLVELREYREADALLVETVVAQTRVLGPAHRDTLETMRTQAYSASKQGLRGRSLRIFRERWRLSRTHLGEENQLTTECQSVVANILRDQGRYAEAEPIYRQALAVRARLLGDAHPATQQSRRDLARLLRLTGRAPEAEVLETKLGARPPEG